MPRLDSLPSTWPQSARFKKESPADFPVPSAASAIAALRWVSIETLLGVTVAPVDTTAGVRLLTVSWWMAWYCWPAVRVPNVVSWLARPPFPLIWSSVAPRVALPGPPAARPTEVQLLAGMSSAVAA